MSDNSDTITALARLEEAERENQKLRSERLLAEHARDEAQREVGRVRDMLAIAERDRDIYRTNSYDWEADCGDWRKRAEAAESELFGMGTALQMVKEQLATAEARVRELEARNTKLEDWNCELQTIIDNDGYPSGEDYRQLEARLRAVTEAGDAMRDALLDRAYFMDTIAVNVATRWDAARTADLPHRNEPELERMGVPPLPDALRKPADLPPHAGFNLEAMLTDCVPGGYSCDPQAVADEIRAWFAKLDLPPHPDTVTLDKVLHDPSYEGGVQYWIRKHDEVEATLAGLMMELGKRSPDIRKLINEEMHRREKARAQAGKEGAA